MVLLGALASCPLTDAGLGGRMGRSSHVWSTFVIPGWILIVKVIKNWKEEVETLHTFFQTRTLSLTSWSSLPNAVKLAKVNASEDFWARHVHFVVMLMAAIKISGRDSTNEKTKLAKRRVSFPLNQKTWARRRASRRRQRWQKGTR